MVYRLLSPCFSSEAVCVVPMTLSVDFTALCYAFAYANFV